jgi:hypothetical protein
MKTAIIVLQGADHQTSTAEALCRGMAVCNDKADVFLSVEDYRRVSNQYDAVCAWGWRKCQPLHDAGKPTLVMERAYLLDRYEWVSLGWNGLNGKARWPYPTDDSRWRRYFYGSMKPWNSLESTTDKETGYVLVLGQVPSDTACRHIHFESWVGNITSALKLKGWTVVFRPHPQAQNVRVSTQVIVSKDQTLEYDFSGAAFAVTFNSNSGVDAVMHGVPTITMDNGSMAWDVTSHDLDDPLVVPDRTIWGTAIAWKQWLPEEISDGTAWRAVRSALPRRTV